MKIKSQISLVFIVLSFAVNGFAMMTSDAFAQAA